MGSGGVLQPSVEVGRGRGYGDMPALGPPTKLGFPVGPHREGRVRRRWGTGRREPFCLAKSCLVVPRSGATRPVRVGKACSVSSEAL